jgi:hypothetical protein
MFKTLTDGSNSRLVAAVAVVVVVVAAAAVVPYYLYRLHFHFHQFSDDTNGTQYTSILITMYMAAGSSTCDKHLSVSFCPLVTRQFLSLHNAFPSQIGMYFYHKDSVTLHVWTPNKLGLSTGRRNAPA